MGLLFKNRDRYVSRYPEDNDATLDEMPPVEPVNTFSVEQGKRLEAERQLEDLNRKHEALAARLAGLERMLAEPEAGQNAILYYRLCAIWTLCSCNLELLAKRFIDKYDKESGVQKPEDLPVDKRRAINILLISMAQEYYLLFAESQIADMARQAANKSVDSVHFGMAEECLEFGHKVRELTARARAEDSLGDTLRRRAKFLHESLRFDENDCIPRATSLNSMPQKIGSGGDALHDYSNSVPVNVLALDYWSLKSVLLS